MEKVVYLTAYAEDRCKREIALADEVAMVYGDWKAAERVRERAYKRLHPYMRVWQELGRREREGSK